MKSLGGREVRRYTRSGPNVKFGDGNDGSFVPTLDTALQRRTCELGHHVLDLAADPGLLHHIFLSLSLEIWLLCLLNFHSN